VTFVKKVRGFRVIYPAVAIDDFQKTLVAELLLDPSLSALGEDRLEVAFEEGAGVLEVLFGVGFGGGDALSFIQMD
jgi:hypothetical protein